MLGKTLFVAAVGLSVAVAIKRARRALLRTTPITATVTIQRPPSEVYALFRDFRRFPEFMSYVSRIEDDGELSTWHVRVPALGEVSWRARITDDVPNKLIAWRTEPESLVQTRGRVTFERAPGRDSTEVRVELQLGARGGAPTAKLARLFAGPQVKGDLRRFKQIAETGEVLRSDASAHALPHAAQPADDARPAPPLFVPHVANAQLGGAS